MKPRIQIRTLQQKTVMFVLVPMFLFLTALGWGGFIFAKNSLLKQWSETATANLQKAAHQVDMRLTQPKSLLERLNYTSGTNMAHLTLRYTIEQLEKLDGVSNVDMKWPSSHIDGGMGMAVGGHHSSEPLNITFPYYSWEKGASAVSLISSLSGLNDEQKGSIEVEITVADLVEKFAESEWWKSNRTLLIDIEGNILAQSAYENDKVSGPAGSTRFGTDDPLGKRTLAAIQNNSQGTVFGAGNPPQEISSFFRLSSTSWYMVVMAPGRTVLQPILKFSIHYGVLFAVAIILIIIFIRLMIAKMTRAIHELSVAADDLAGGVFGPPLPVRAEDELGELTRSFNTMTSHIKKGMELQKAMEIAREVQQNFLPGSRLETEGVEIYGFCRYCQDTGGDFYDFIQLKNSPAKVGAVVGDVVGHGIGAALLMASVRAMIRSRVNQPGNLAEITTEVNKILCRDTEISANFVTLFLIAVDPLNRTIEWVRAGHDPGWLIYPDRQKCIELRGNGVAVGVERSLEYESNLIETTAEKQLVIIGSDGAWEAENAYGELFGKQRIVDVLLKNCGKDSGLIVELINKEIDSFLEDSPPQDDITFVVIKIDGKKLSKE